jgi:hypothetical protein
MTYGTYSVQGQATAEAPLQWALRCPAAVASYMQLEEEKQEKEEVKCYHDLLLRN